MASRCARWSATRTWRRRHCPGSSWRPGDLTDVGSLARAVAGVDIVYNVAALYRAAGLDDNLYRAVNATAVGTLIEAAGAAGVKRVVHCSTVGVHGDIAARRPTRTRRCARATSIRRRSSKGRAWRGAPPPTPASSS